VWKSWCLFLSLRANPVVSIFPVSTWRWKQAHFFETSWCQIMDNIQKLVKPVIVSSESVKANFFGCPPLKVQFLYLNQLSQTQIAYGSNR
jgi:hypothetical protein